MKKILQSDFTWLSFKPADKHLALVSFKLASLLPDNVKLQPNEAKYSAVAAPMPELAPTMFMRTVDVLNDDKKKDKVVFFSYQ